MLPVQGNITKQITIGGYTFDWDPTNNPNDIQLYHYVGGATAINATGRKGSSTTGYAVPSGKTLYLIAFLLISTNTIGEVASFCQSDNDTGELSSTAAVNPVYLGGSANKFIGGVASAIGAQAGVGGLAFPVAALKYLTLSSGATASSGMIGVSYCKLV